MVFKVGETVVYPHHGAARIDEIKERTVRGQKLTYLRLAIIQGDLMIEVPADNVELVGVRDVTSTEGLEKVYDVLREDEVDEPSNWSRRFKANGEKLASGDVLRVSEVVRDLSRRHREKHLSAGEKSMLAKARGVLVSELALARKTSEEDAGRLLDEVLAA